MTGKGTVIWDRIVLQNTQDPFLLVFFAACEERNLPLIVTLTEGRDPHDGSLTKALKNAFEASHLDVAECLLDRGALIDIPTLLTINSEAGFQILNAHIEEPMSLSYEAISTAIVAKNELLVRFLLSHGVNPSFGPPQITSETLGQLMEFMPPVKNSGECLNCAAANSTPAILDLLLAHGAKLENSNALLLAVSNRHHSISMMERLIEAGVDINALKFHQGIHHGTALHCACAYGRVEEARWLMEHGADPSKKNMFGSTPGGEAVLKNQPDNIIQLFYDMGLLKKVSVKEDTSGGPPRSSTARS